MKYIFLDLENTQPTGEIIQIGLVGWDTQMKSTSFNSIFVEQDVNWTQQLEGTNKTLEEFLGFDRTVYYTNALPPAEAFQQAYDWMKDTGGWRNIVQWGRSDYHELLTQGKQHGVRFSSKAKVLNLKLVYEFIMRPTLSAKHRKGGSGLGKAIDSLDMVFSGNAHDAQWDAWNTMRVMAEHLRLTRQSVDIEHIIIGGERL